MRVHLDCFPCFLRQSVIALRYGTKDAGIQEKILKAVLSDIERTDTSQPPAYTTTFIHRTIREHLNKDPFKEIKSEYNQIGLGLYPGLRRMVEESSDPLWTASRLAIAGNIIDFGIFTSVDIDGTIKRAVGSPLAVDHYPEFRKRISHSGEILYLLDNAGEVVFDRILIETMQSRGKKVVAVVKGSPVLNDCTEEDAVEVGLNRVCEIIDNGSDAVGTILEWTSAQFQKRFMSASCIVSKGQGNFETLAEDPERETFYLFQSKCEVVSRELGLSLGSMLLMKAESHHH